MNQPKNTKNFFKKNLYYFIALGCLIAIATVMTIVVATSQPKPTVPNAPVDKPIIVEPKIEYCMPTSSDNVTISQGHTTTQLVYSPTLKLWQTHEGVDIEMPVGSNVVSVCDGKVLEVGSNQLDGSYIVIVNSDNVKCIYKNLQSELNVKKDDQVTIGQVIGKVGKSMLSEAGQTEHLHFEMEDKGVSVNPEKFITELGNK